jgi:eukaryotic-like serine/threonine-protein kinase
MSAPKDERVTKVEPAVMQTTAGEFVDASSTQTGGRYEIRTMLGRGGMATVHLALDRILLREVALKFLDTTETSSTLVERFVIEAQITAQLDHPNIVPVHDLSVFGDPPYFVMKLVGGHSLSDHLHKRSDVPRDPETLDDLLGVFVKVCDAIAFAHSRGVVHRDLKPDNVMVDTFGRVYLMDWGLARVMPGSHAGGRIEVALKNAADDGSGTVAYMAPEQACPGWRPIGPWTDVYALGAILYEIITGRPPHVAATHDALRELAFNGEIAPPETHVPGGLVAPALSRIVLRAAAREPQHRYESVEDLKRDIARFVRGGTRFSTRTYAAGEVVVREGEVGDHAYVIRQGRAVAYKTIGEERIVLREMGPGDAFGEMALLSDTVRTATVEALESLSVHVVDRESLNQGLGLDSWSGAVVRALADRFRDIDAKLTAAEIELRRLKGTSTP